VQPKLNDTTYCKGKYVWTIYKTVFIRTDFCERLFIWIAHFVHQCLLADSLIEDQMDSKNISVKVTEQRRPVLWKLPWITGRYLQGGIESFLSQRWKLQYVACHTIYSYPFAEIDKRLQVYSMLCWNRMGWVRNL
jgi:hypothetical protein